MAFKMKITVFMTSLTVCSSYALCVVFIADSIQGCLIVKTKSKSRSPWNKPKVYWIYTNLAVNKSTDYRYLNLSVSRRKRFDGSRIRYYSNSNASFQLMRFSVSGDINPNPGPEISERNTCAMCERTLARNHRIVECTICGLKYHTSVGMYQGGIIKE